MINLGICLKCDSRRKITPSQFEKAGGKIVALAVVDCRVYGSELTADSEIPDDCPYILEHKMTEEEAFNMACDLEETVEEDWGGKPHSPPVQPNMRKGAAEDETEL